MAGPILSGKIESYRYYDTVNSGLNPVPPYQLIMPLTSAQLTSTGGVEGEAVRAGETGGTDLLGRILGVSSMGSKSGTQLGVQVDGIAHVMMGAAVARGAWLFMAVAEQQSNTSAPLINLFELNLPVEPGVGITYNLAMADDTAVTPATTGANALYCPIGISLEAGTAKYELIRVKLFNQPFYA